MVKPEYSIDFFFLLFLVRRPSSRPEAPDAPDDPGRGRGQEAVEEGEAEGGEGKGQRGPGSGDEEDAEGRGLLERLGRLHVRLLFLVVLVFLGRGRRRLEQRRRGQEEQEEGGQEGSSSRRRPDERQQQPAGGHQREEEEGAQEEGGFFVVVFFLQLLVFGLFFFVRVWGGGGSREEQEQAEEAVFLGHQVEAEERQEPGQEAQGLPSRGRGAVRPEGALRLVQLSVPQGEDGPRGWREGRLRSSLWREQVGWREQLFDLAGIFFCKARWSWQFTWLCPKETADKLRLYLQLVQNKFVSRLTMD